MNNIEGLQESVRSSLRSSIILFDLPRVVEELTHNSVDSGATEVHVSLSVSECHVKVEDNGCGITRDGLVILGERYATSKIDLSIDPQANSESLGFRAEALASLSDVSLVEIRTKARGRPNAYCKIMKGSKCLFFGIDDQREAVGTTVIVRDLFYNQPVRRKYMLNSPKRVLHTTKKCVFRIALVHPQVSFKVIDKDSEDELLCTIPSSSPLSLVLDGFGHEVSRSLHKIVFSEQMLMLSGYISGRSNAFSTKDFQYLYINSRFVCKCPIHDLLNNLASTPLCSMAHHKVESDSQSEKRQRTRAYPAYLLNLCCPVTSYDLYFEPSKTFVEFKDWNPILSFLERAIKQFWKQLSEDLLKGKSFGQDNIVTIESEVQKEEMLTTDILMNSEMKREQCNLWLHPNSPLHSPISSPQDMILEHVKKFQKDGILSKEMPLSSVLKPCQSLTNRRCQPECTSQHVTHDTYDDFTSEHGHMDCSNSNLPQWITDVGSSTLDRHFFSNQTLTFEDKDDKAELETDLPESSSCLRKELHRRTLISHSYEFTSNAEQMQFPLASPCASSKVDTEVSILMENDKDHSVYYTDSFNQFKNNSSLNATVGAIEADFHKDSLSPDTIFHAKFDFSSPCSVTRKCQIAGELDVTSIDHIGCFTIEEPFLSFRNNLHQGVAARVFVASPKCVSPEVGWHLDSQDGFFARKVTQGVTLRGELEDSISVGYRYHDTAKMIESLNSDTPIEALTASHKKRKLDYQKYLSPKRTKQHDFYIDRTSVEKLGSSSTVYDETDWSLETSDRKVTDIYNDTEFKMCGQNQDVLAENQYDEQKFGTYQQPNACKIMSYRSSSAPPFYTGKQKFPVLKDHHRTAGKDSSLHSSYDANTSPDGLSEASASQPYPKPKYDEICQPSFSIDVNLGTIEMNGLQNLERLEKEHHNPSSPCNAIAGFINGEMEYASATLTKWRTGIPQPIGGDMSYGSHHSPQNKDEILNVCSVHFSDSSLVPQSISRDCLDDARVLLQLDRKFIPVVAGGILIAIDQHAADERIRLEELRRKVLLEEGSSIAYLDSEKELVLPEMGFQLLQKYVEPIQRWGWICSINTQASESFAKDMNLLKRRAHGVTLTAVPCILGIKLTDKDLIEFIEQLVETDGSSTIPPAVLRILNYKACRGAIMFGDSLLPSECSLIVEELKATSLCFQCAHGRPTTVPLLNMASLHDLLTAQEMEKGSVRDSWHGLRRYAPSVERAQLRLESAKRFRGG